MTLKKSAKKLSLNSNGEKSFEHLNKAAALELPGLLAEYNSAEGGLNSAEAKHRLDMYGYNEVQHEKAPPWYLQLFHAFVTPFNGVLFLVALVSVFTDVWIASPQERDYKTVIVVLILILLSSLIRFWQEFRSNKAAAKLRSMIKTTVNVLREARNIEIPLKQLVPGDIILLSAGDMIPADCRVIQSKDLLSVTMANIAYEDVTKPERSS